MSESVLGGEGALLSLNGKEPLVLLGSLLSVVSAIISSSVTTSTLVL